MDRRKFLIRTLPAAGVIPGMVSGFPFRTFASDNAFVRAAMMPYIETDHVLVLVQLQGGNDGLNTVIPLDAYSNYLNARSNIAIPERSILKLQGIDKSGFHPALSGFQQLFNEGKLSVVQAVGYPSQNLSHFRSTDIWMSASESNTVENSGWIGRYLDNEYPGYPDLYPSEQMPDPLAIQVGSITSLTCQGPAVSMGMSISNTSSIYNYTDSIQDPVPNSPMGYELNYIRQIAKQTDKYTERIRQAASKVTQQGTYPDNSLGAQLKVVARLIKGGLKTRIYMVGMGGFDTHSLQVSGTDTTTGPHANLLRDVSTAIKAFMDDIKTLGVDNRVTGMTFSEFGRRIRSNGSAGTDHGAAAPLFLFGNNVTSGIIGTNPYIAANVTPTENIPFQYDFRSIYASVLQQWFCVPDDTLQRVMLKNFQTVPLINGTACATASPPQPGPTPDPLDPAEVLISNYPNPFSTATSIKFKTKGGYTLIQVLDTSGHMIKVLVDKEFTEAGEYSVSFDSEALPSGIYYARLQNSSIQQVRAMIKAR